MSRTPHAAPAAPRAGRVLHYDALRALAIVGVVVVHVAALEWGSVDPAGFTWQAFNVFDGLVRWCVPVFVMLSGALMLNPARETAFRRLLSKNVGRIALAFVVWSAVYLVWDVARGEMAATPKELLSAFVGGHYHLWYLQMQAFLYLAIPLLRPIAADKKLSALFLALWAALCLLPGLLFMSQAVSDVFGGAYANANVSLVCGYAGYFVLGSFLAQTELSRAKRAGLYAAGVAGAVFTVAGTSWLSVSAGFARSELYGYLMPNVAVTAAALFVGVRQVLSGERAERFTSSRLGRVVGELSSASFGIYLVHLLVLEGLVLVGATPSLGGGVVGVMLLSFGVLLVSCAAVRLMRKIPALGSVL